MGAQYPITFGSGMTSATWYKLGALSLTSGVRVFSLQVTTQSPLGGFRPAWIRFSTNNGNYVENSYDATPISFNAHVQVQTTSPGWWYDTLGTDIAVTQLSNTSYAFYLKVYPNIGTGFFSVQHSTGGDSFAFEGTYSSTTRPANGIHPTVAPLVTADQIGAASSSSPTITGTLSCQNLAASGTVSIPDGSLSIADTFGLQTALNGKATLGANVNFGSCDLVGSLTFGGNLTGGPNSQLSAYAINSSTGFGSLSGSLTTTSSSQTIYSFSAASENRGFVVVEAASPNNSTVLGFFDSRSGNTFLTILARQGNATGATNLSTANTGTLNITLTCNTSGQLRLSTPSTGTCFWSIVFI